MKKHIFLAAILAATSSFSLAEGTNFTGFGVGAEIGTTKYSGVDEGSKSKRMTDINLVGSYGFVFSSTELVGQVEAKYKVGSSKVYDDEYGVMKVKRSWSVGYLQGYRVTPTIMSYVKLAYVSNKYQDEVASKAHGVGYGVGAKFVVAQNVEVGAEFVQARLKDNDPEDKTKFKSNSFNLGVAYRF
ncbi:MAG: outer membrane beta-barrel protein [Kingella sp. (in: b-proteobacteria)]